jgi:phenylalanyl-tRNA synthetase alpha subunit
VVTSLTFCALPREVVSKFCRNMTLSKVLPACTAGVRCLPWTGRGFATVRDDFAKFLDNGHPRNNVPQSVKSKVGVQLHRQPLHPLNIIKTTISDYFNDPSAPGAVPFKLFDDLSPIVTTKQNFDELLTPKDHVSRNPSDTFYVSDDLVLRTHTRWGC